jgi:hypothetical protein
MHFILERRQASLLKGAFIKQHTKLAFISKSIFNHVDAKPKKKIPPCLLSPEEPGPSL